MAILAWRVKLSSRPDSQKIKSVALFKKLQDISSLFTHLKRTGYATTIRNAWQQRPKINNNLLLHLIRNEGA